MTKTQPFEIKDAYFKQKKEDPIIFDYEKAQREFFNNNKMFALKCLTRLQQDSFSAPDGLIYKLIKSYQEKNLERFHRNSHSLKGNVKYFFGMKLAEQAYIVQLQAQAEQEKLKKDPNHKVI